MRVAGIRGSVAIDGFLVLNNVATVDGRRDSPPTITFRFAEGAELKRRFTRTEKDELP